MEPLAQFCIAAVVAAKKRANRRPRYVLGLEAYLAAFFKGKEGRPLSSFTPAELESFLFKGNPAASRAASNLGRLASCFTYAKRQGWITTSPADLVEKIQIEPAAPRAFTAREARRLLQSATLSNAGRRILPALVLGLFAGVRPEEVTGLSWGAVDFSRALLLVSKTKTRDRRLAPLSLNAIRWLQWSRTNSGELPPHGNFKRARRTLCARSRVVWSQDVLRKTAATMLHAAGQTPAQITRALGNSTRILFDHYVAALAVTAEEAADFWAIQPPDAQTHFPFIK